MIHRHIALSPPKKREFIVEIETGDPDDILALIILLTHPDVELKAIAVTPGTPTQMGLIAHIQRQFGRDIPMGGTNPKKDPGDTHLRWYIDQFGPISPMATTGSGPELIRTYASKETTMVCCGPPTNLANAYDLDNQIQFQSVFFQGGFAGSSFVPSEYQLPKFYDVDRCRSWNFSAGKRVTTLLSRLTTNQIPTFLISKNVCHGVFWGPDLAEIPKSSTHEGFRFLQETIVSYDERRGRPKALHDLLAVACAIDPEVGKFKRGDVNHQKKKGWSTTTNPGSNISISVHYDREKFKAAISGTYN